jgi:hypothetical protein
MTSTEIEIMAGGGYCHIVNEAGLYLHFEEGTPQFKEGTGDAVIYHFISDNVTSQIAQVKDSFGADWYAVPVKGGRR